MYNLILCDDEPVILKGLSRSVPWQDYNLRVQGCFEDGRDVMDYLRGHPVDVIVTDIDMADVTGLELARHVCEQYPSVKVVILSGLKDFEYAKKAIQYSVFHYLVKPIDFDEIDEVFADLTRQLDAERAERLRQEQEQRRFEEVLPILREQFFTDLLFGALRSKPQAIASRLQLLQLGVDPHRYGVTVLRAALSSAREQADGTRGRQYDSAINYIKAELGEQQRWFGILTGSVQEPRLIVVADEAVDVRERDAYLESLSAAVVQIYGVHAAWVHEARYESLVAAAQTIIPLQLDGSITSGIGGETALKPGEYERLVQQYKLLVSNLYDGNKDKADSIMERLFQEMEGLPVAIVQRLVIDLFAMISSHIADWGGQVSGLTGGRLDYAQLMRMSSLDQIRQWCQRILEQVLSSVNTGREKPYEKLFEKVTAYIQTHYTEDVNLEEVADKVYLNPVYFSRLFKQEMGINFTEYLTKVRMAKAKELLQSGRYKSYEVSELTGYRSSKYFTKVFKQETGYTPMAFSRMFEESE